MDVSVYGCVACVCLCVCTCTYILGQVNLGYLSMGAVNIVVFCFVLLR